METRGLVYRVIARRNDGGWIHYRTCDRQEATAVAARLGAVATVVAGARRPGSDR
jgi:hypothetical protein